MPTEKERKYYRMGYQDGFAHASEDPRKQYGLRDVDLQMGISRGDTMFKAKPKRKTSDWIKFIKANSKKKKYKFANGKLKLKSMGIAYRKTAAYKRNKKK
jgi:hypothetical protein